MKLGGRLVLVSLAVPFLCLGQSKELVATQQVIRDLANLEDRTRAAQKATDDKLEKLLQQTQAAIDAATKANASVAGLEPILKDQVAEQQKSQANTGLKVTQMAEDLQTVKESVNAQNARLGKLEQLITDLKTALTTLHLGDHNAIGPLGAKALAPGLLLRLCQAPGRGCIGCQP